MQIDLHIRQHLPIIVQEKVVGLGSVPVQHNCLCCYNDVFPHIFGLWVMKVRSLGKTLRLGWLAQTRNSGLLVWDREWSDVRGTMVSDKELEPHLVESGAKLLDILLSVDELLPVLDVSPIVFLLLVVVF